MLSLFQATNFLRAFRTLPEASALGLLISDNGNLHKSKSMAHTIQNWNRFVLRQLHQVYKLIFLIILTPLMFTQSFLGLFCVV